MSMELIFSKIASRHGVTSDEVYRDIQQFIALASSSSDPEVQQLWAALQPDGDPLSPEELILFLVLALSE